MLYYAMLYLLNDIHNKHDIITMCLRNATLRSDDDFEDDYDEDHEEPERVRPVDPGALGSSLKIAKSIWQHLDTPSIPLKMPIAQATSGM